MNFFIFIAPFFLRLCHILSFVCPKSVVGDRFHNFCSRNKPLPQDNPSHGKRIAQNFLGSQIFSEVAPAAPGQGHRRPRRWKPLPPSPKDCLPQSQNTCAVFKIKIIILMSTSAASAANPFPHPGGSSNGRTAAFGVADLGSNPSPPAKTFLIISAYCGH